MEVYIIKLFIENEVKYFFNSKFTVQNKEYAHKFYSKRRAKSALKNSCFSDCEFELIRIDS